MITRKQGDIGVSAAVYHYTKLGYIVSIPQTEASRYDILIDDGQSVKKVQCKTSSWKRGTSSSYIVQLSTNGGNKSGTGKISYISSQDVDLVFVWCDDESLWEFPAEVCEGKRNIVLSKNKEIYKILSGWTS